MSPDLPSTTSSDQVPVITTTTDSTNNAPTDMSTPTSTSDHLFQGQAEQVVILGPIDPTLPTVEPLEGYSSIPQVNPGKIGNYDQDDVKDDGEEERREMLGAGDELDVPLGDERRKTRPESYMTALTRLNSKDREVEEDEEVGGHEREVGGEEDKVEGVPEVVVVDTTDTGVNAGGTALNTVETTASGPTTDLPPNSTTTTTTAPLNPRDGAIIHDPRPTPLPRPSVVHNFPQDERSLSTSKRQKEKEKTTLSLKTWWKNFSSSGSGSSPNSGSNSAGAQAGKRTRKGSLGEGYGEGEVFAKTLEVSLRYASVQISTTRADGGLFVWG